MKTSRPRKSRPIAAGTGSHVAASDPTSIKPDPARAVRARFNDGWAEWEGAWIVKGAGAFARAPQPRSSRLGTPTPAEFERVVGAMDAAAAASGGGGARALYFTIRPGGEARKAPLENLGFKHADDDVFVRRDLAASPKD